MFVEGAEAPLEGLKRLFEKSRLISDPPPGLRAVVAWETSDGQGRALVVWDSASQRGDWAAERVVPLYAAGALEGVPGSDRLQPEILWMRDLTP